MTTNPLRPSPGSFPIDVNNEWRLETPGNVGWERSARPDAADGVDAEILFPNKGLTMWVTKDVEFSSAMCRAYNDWAWDTFGDQNDRLAPMACVASADIQGAITEIQRCAALGFRGLNSAELFGFPIPARYLGHGDAAAAADAAGRVRIIT